VQLVLQKRIERKTAGILLYALQISSSNLKRMELEKPQPEQVVTDLETESETPTPALIEEETARESSDESSDESSTSPQHEWDARPVNASTKTGEDKKNESDRSDETLPPGTIHACYRPGPQWPAVSPR